ncbi:MAG TPA: FAD-dependent oxidoreductase [Propionibacteriaceae bacterium]|nr:FAD-dependent oxidoreductase [Propionibacteriaceae bacterium]
MSATLLSPLLVGSLELKNRMAVAPMVTCYCDDDGMPTEQYIAYHEARAKGGFGLIITEDYAVDPRGRGFWCAGLWKDEQIAPHRELTERVHAAGAKIFAQIYHCGRQTSAALIGAQPVSASALACPTMGEVPHALTKDEIRVIVGQFGDTAHRAELAGFDGVEVHGAHGYLIAQFMSSYSNKRTDEYGGTLLNRLRFPLEVIEDIRAKCRPDFVVSFRISADEYVIGGRDLAETTVICQQLEAAGIDLVHITAGTYESAWAIIPPLGRPYGWLAECAARIKQVVSIPVQVVGRIKDPFVGDAILAAGQADLVSFGRASLADPDLPRKYAEGHPEQIRQCIGCNQGCIAVLFTNKPIRCLVNPSLGFEGAREVQPAAVRKKVVVVGGGPAGLEAARGARLAGHDVVLHERNDHLGGNFVIGAVPPGKGELTSYITWLREEVCRLGVHVELGSTGSPEVVRGESPDVVVYAAGAKHVRPPIPGIDGANVVDACDVLAGRANPGSRVVVAGGGMIGSETALYLASIGRQVTVVDQLPAIALEENAARRYYLMKELDGYKVETVANATITAFTDAGVEVCQDGQQRTLPCDTVVMALGMAPDVQSLEALREVADVKVVGDAVEAADGLRASREGFVCGLSV